MMLNKSYSVFFIVALATVLLLVGYFSFSATQTQDPKKKAFEVAHDACGIFRKMGIEQVNNSEAVLETWGESTVSKVWVVQLTGTQQSVVTPASTIEMSNTPDSSVPPSEWLIVCEVFISSNDWHVISTKQTRTKISP
jgi:hypothetical protein